MTGHKWYANNSDFATIHNIWDCHNKRVTGYGLSKLGLLVSMTLLGFDFVFFGDDANLYTGFRLATIVTFALLLIFCGKDYKVKEMNHVDLVLLFIPIFFHSQYLWFYINAPSDIHRNTIESAFYMNILALNYFIRNHWREQLIVGLYLLLSSIFLSIQSGGQNNEANSFVFWSLISFYIAYSTRKTFSAELMARYSNYLTKSSKKLAIELTVKANIKMQELFPLKDRETLILTGDWRGFQKIAAQNTDRDVTELISSLHNVIYDLLDSNVDEENFAFDWFGDAVFIIVTKGNGKHFNKTLVNILKVIAEKTRNSFLSVSKSSPLMDFGASLGVCPSGYIGPDHHKKITTLGEVAGVAARLESQAKLHRKLSTTKNPHPVLGVSLELFNLIEKTDPDFAGKFRKEDITIDKGEDVKEGFCYIFQVEA